MKIAVLFHGLSISNKYNHWQYKEKVSFNIKHNINNLNEFLLKKYNCDVYFHTWKNKEVPEKEYVNLVNILNPQKYVMDEDISYSAETLGEKIKTTRIKVIECFIEHSSSLNINYDMIILMRFDIFFLKPLLLEKIIIEKNHIYLYDITENNCNKKIINKNECLTNGIDDNFIIFSCGNSLIDYLNAAKKKKNIRPAGRRGKLFRPEQHPSFHHIYYLLTNITILNLNILWNKPYNNEQLYGLVKEKEINLDKNSFLLNDNIYINKYK